MLNQKGYVSKSKLYVWFRKLKITFPQKNVRINYVIIISSHTITKLLNLIKKILVKIISQEHKLELKQVKKFNINKRFANQKKTKTSVTSHMHMHEMHGDTTTK